MKLYLCLWLALVVCCGMLLQAGEVPKPVVVALSEDDFRQGNAHPGKEVTLAAGDKLIVKLGSNPTTGYRWTEQVANTNAAVLKQVNHAYEQSSHATGPGGEPMAGAGGTEVWTFEALKAGQTVLDFSYGRPWQGGEKGTWTLKLTVKVK